MERVELDIGAFGTIYYDSDGKRARLDAVRPGRARSRARRSCPAGRRPTTRCSSPAPTSSTDSSPWVLQSLFLAAIGESRDSGARALEAFSYRYAEGESSYERFRVHKTVFPQDFLADFGFQVVRSAGRIGLSRLELGGLVPVVEGRAREGAAGRAGRVRRCPSPYRSVRGPRP